MFWYNAASGGDELYGVEPVSFYVKNLLLNLNLVAPLGMMALPLCGYYAYSQRRASSSSSSSSSSDGARSDKKDAGVDDVLVLLSSLVLWLLITFPRPHKEERFLFPIYPLLVIGAVLVVDHVVMDLAGGLMASFTRHKQLSQRQRFGLHSLFWIPVVLLSLSRTVALNKYYGAPSKVYASLSQHVVVTTTQVVQDDPQTQRSMTTVCTCGEWYRFPSSFYLPDGVQLGFLPSSFHGQLPQPFSEYGSSIESQSVLQPFNDRNLEEMQRYVESPSQCDWVIDLEGSECAQSLAKQAVLSVPFLDADKTSAIHRILYIPFLHETAMARGAVSYRNYVLNKVGE